MLGTCERVTVKNQGELMLQRNYFFYSVNHTDREIILGNPNEPSISKREAEEPVSTIIHEGQTSVAFAGSEDERDQAQHDSIMVKVSSP